jgi:hypothetical protein
LIAVNFFCAGGHRVLSQPNPKEMFMHSILIIPHIVPSLQNPFTSMDIPVLEIEEPEDLADEARSACAELSEDEERICNMATD